MKIIFLDMDGVMNSIQSVMFFHDFIGMQSNWFQRYMPGDIDPVRNYENEICPMAVSNMRALLKNHPDIRFVISSTWRRGRDEEWFNKLFKHIGITGDNHCYWCDGEGKYSGGEDCRKCNATGVLKCPIGDDDLVIGRTPYLSAHERGEEIQDWLDNDGKKYDIEEFAILDDDSDMAHLYDTPHFIQTDGKVGFDYRKKEEVDKLFAGFKITREQAKPNTPYRMFSKPRETIYYYDDKEDKFYYFREDGSKSIGVTFFKNDLLAEVRDERDNPES